MNGSNAGDRRGGRRVPGGGRHAFQRGGTWPQRRTAGAKHMERNMLTSGSARRAPPSRCYIRKTPKRGSGIGAFSAAEQAQPQNVARLARVDHPVVPEPRRGVEAVRLAVELLDDRLLDGALLLLGEGAARPLDGLLAHRRQHAGRLLAAHDRDARVRPRPQEARAKAAPAHAVVAGAEAAADHHRHLRHLRAADRVHHLRAVLGDALGLVFPADHVAGDILQENQRDTPLAAELDEVRGLQRALGDRARRCCPGSRRGCRGCGRSRSPASRRSAP